MHSPRFLLTVTSVSHDSSNRRLVKSDNRDPAPYSIKSVRFVSDYPGRDFVI